MDGMSSRDQSVKSQCIDRRRVKKWTIEEDNKMADLVAKLGTGRWTLISSHMPGRTGKQCRERWHNHLDPNVLKSPWTLEEEKIFKMAHAKHGNAWAIIAKLLPGRTDNAVKNYWNSAERKKLRAQARLRRNRKDSSGLTSSVDDKSDSELEEDTQERLHAETRRVVEIEAAPAAGRVSKRKRPNPQDDDEEATHHSSSLSKKRMKVEDTTTTKIPMRSSQRLKSKMITPINTSGTESRMKIDCDMGIPSSSSTPNDRSTTPQSTLAHHTDDQYLLLMQMGAQLILANRFANKGRSEYETYRLGLDDQCDSCESTPRRIRGPRFVSESPDGFSPDWAPPPATRGLMQSNRSPSAEPTSLMGTARMIGSPQDRSVFFSDANEIVHFEAYTPISSPLRGDALQVVGMKMSPNQLGSLQARYGDGQLCGTEFGEDPILGLPSDRLPPKKRFMNASASSSPSKPPFTPGDGSIQRS